MLCEKCGKREANVKYTQIVNGHKSSLNVCAQCAAAESVFENFGSFLNFREREASPVSCPTCGMTLSELSAGGRMGCGNCYSVFRTYADSMLKKIHGTSKHTESAHEVKENKKQEDKEENLKKLLKKAIEEENFEEAARLRDLIREQEGK